MAVLAHKKLKATQQSWLRAINREGLVMGRLHKMGVKTGNTLIQQA
jgi:hypothetical protein